MQDEAVGPDNIPGFDKVEALANYLLRFRQESGVISQSHAGKIVNLWDALHSFDRTVSRKPHHQPKLTKGRFIGILLFLDLTVPEDRQTYKLF